MAQRTSPLTRRQMCTWVEFFDESHPYSEGFSPSTEASTSKFQFHPETVNAEPFCDFWWTWRRAAKSHLRLILSICTEKAKSSIAL